MDTIEVGCSLGYQVNQSTSFLFQIAVIENKHQTVLSETVSITPDTPFETCQIGETANRMYRLVVQGPITVDYKARIGLNRLQLDARQLNETRHQDLPPEVLPYLYPSRYCESDKLARFAWQEFQNVEAGYTRVQSIVSWVNQHLSYEIGTTGPWTTACDVLLCRTGVCRDYAHLCIALCRALGIPARYVAGYAVQLQPPDFHGFFEAYLGDAWFLFDATHLAPVSGFVRISVGRDAADVSFATIIGSAFSTHMNVWAYPTNDTTCFNATDNLQAISTAD